MKVRKAKASSIDLESDRYDFDPSAMLPPILVADSDGWIRKTYPSFHAVFGEISQSMRFQDWLDRVIEPHHASCAKSLYDVLLVLRDNFEELKNRAEDPTAVASFVSQFQPRDSSTRIFLFPPILEKSRWRMGAIASPQGGLQLKNGAIVNGEENSEYSYVDIVVAWKIASPNLNNRNSTIVALQVVIYPAAQRHAFWEDSLRAAGGRFLWHTWNNSIASYLTLTQQSNDSIKSCLQKFPDDPHLESAIKNINRAVNALSFSKGYVRAASIALRGLKAEKDIEDQKLDLREVLGKAFILAVLEYKDTFHNNERTANQRFVHLDGRKLYMPPFLSYSKNSETVFSLPYLKYNDQILSVEQSASVISQRQLLVKRLDDFPDFGDSSVVDPPTVNIFALIGAFSELFLNAMKFGKKSSLDRSILINIGSMGESLEISIKNEHEESLNPRLWQPVLGGGLDTAYTFFRRVNGFSGKEGLTLNVNKESRTIEFVAILVPKYWQTVLNCER